MPNETKRVGLVLEPLDTLFFRDGRPFENATRASSGLPMPQTLAGALRTFMLRNAECDFTCLGKRIRSGKPFKESLDEKTQPIAEVRFRGPWLAYASKDGGAPEPLFPCPSTLLRVETDGERSERIIRLNPLRDSVRLPGWSDTPAGRRPLWTRTNERGKQTGGFLTLKGLFAFLRREEVKPEHIKPESELFGWDDRTGIAINPDARSVEESMIYAIRLLSLNSTSDRRVVFYAEVDGPDDALKYLPTEIDAMPFGGEGRSVAIRPVSPVTFPEIEGTGDGTLVLLTSSAPTSSKNPTVPEGLGDSDAIVAMSVPGSIAVSGWDLARGGPKKTRFGVPAGSVYFLRESIRNHLDSLCGEEDAQLGWGTFVEGSWSYV